MNTKKERGKKNVERARRRIRVMGPGNICYRGGGSGGHKEG